jgi:hypothetical protein
MICRHSLKIPVIFKPFVKAEEEGVYKKIISSTQGGELETQT